MMTLNVLIWRAASVDTSLRSRFALSDWRYAVPVLVGTVVFWCISGGKIIHPSNLDWLQAGDMAQHFLGWLFFRNAPLIQNPLGANTAFGLELGSSIVYTDSLPLFAFFFKLFRSFLPDVFQYIGLWILLCFVLQAVLAWKLLERFTASMGVLLLGSCFFSLAPPFLYRLHGHDSLVGHWLILAALLLYFSTEARPARWLALIVVASLVHAYLLLMVCAIWVADLTTRWWNRQTTARATAGWVVATMAALVLVMWQTGYFVLSRDVMVGGGYGFYRMNALAPVNAIGKWSEVFSGWKLGGGDEEGFNFLGLGIVVLAIIALVESFRDASIYRRAARLWPLLTVCLLLTVYAISNRVSLGSAELFSFELPSTLVDHANTFRASGRLFWPVFYMIYLASFYVICKRFTPRLTFRLLAVLLSLQLLDSGQELSRIREALNDPPVWLTPLESPFWKEAASRYGSIQFIPPHNVPANYEPLAFYAASHGLSINVGAFARVDMEKQKQMTDRLTRDALTGTLDRHSLYVFEENKLWRDAIPRLSVHDGAGIVDGLRIIAPGWASCSSCTAAHVLESESEIDRLVPYELGKVISFGERGNSRDYALSGWSVPGRSATWTNGDLATLGMRVKPTGGAPLSMQFWTYAFVKDRAPVQNVDVFVNSTFVSSLAFSVPGRSSRRVRIPGDTPGLADGALLVEFRLKNAIIANPTGDHRRIALGMDAVKIDRVE